MLYDRGCRRRGRLIVQHGAGLAQLVEQLICNHQVASSSPAASTTFPLLEKLRFEGPTCEKLFEVEHENQPLARIPKLCFIRRFRGQIQQLRLVIFQVKQKPRGKA